MTSTSKVNVPIEVIIKEYSVCCVLVDCVFDVIFDVIMKFRSSRWMAYRGG